MIQDGHLILCIPRTPQDYYTLEHTGDLVDSKPIDMNLGLWGPVCEKAVSKADLAAFLPLLAVRAAGHRAWGTDAPRPPCEPSFSRALTTPKPEPTAHTAFL